MLTYLIKRLLWAGVTLLGVTLLAFVVVYRIPADPAALLAGPRAEPEVIARIRQAHRLDRPVGVQYGDFLVRLAQGDMGRSISRDQPVADAIRERLPNTILLALTGWSLWLILGTLIGVVVAARPTPAREGALLLFSIAGVSTPTFWVGILLLYVFVSRLAWLPAGGSGTLRHLLLPAAALALSGVAYYARLAHSTMTETLRQDYIRTAVAKGLSPHRIIYGHALRNALLPLVTIAGADLATLLGGVVFTESVFDWKGMGKLAVEAVNAVDIPLILGVVLVSASVVVVANLLVDLLYPMVDPRIGRQ